MKLKNKVCLVTGAKRGIGLVIAIEMAKAGADIIIFDLDITDEDEVVKKVVELARKIKGYKVDITDKDQVIEAVIKAKNDFKSIDVLVNNAGIYPSTPLLEIEENEWDLVLDVNLKGTFFVTQAVAKYSMVPNKYGKIVNIASSDGKSPSSGIAHYAASKAGVISLTKSFAIELSKNNINSNCVAPGWVESEAVLKGERWKEAIKKIPSGRLGKLEEIAEAVIFLARDEISYINGEIIDVNGGLIMD